MHEQHKDIDYKVKQLEYELSMLGYPNHCIHTGPIIRQEKEYRYMDIQMRRRIFNKIVAFCRQIKVRYKTFVVEKYHFSNAIDAIGQLARQISDFIKENHDGFLEYESVKVYYDNGQIEVNKILSTVFNALLHNVEFKRVIPSKYRLFQVADLICTLELLQLKMEHQHLSKSELLFFGNEKNLKNNYIKQISKMKYTNKK